MKTYAMPLGGQAMVLNNTIFPVFGYKMTETVNGELLEQAVNEALKYNPYFATRIIKDDNGCFHLEENKEKALVPEAQWGKQILYGTEKMHGFPWIVTYVEDSIAFSVAHALTDGTGANQFMNSVLGWYLYYQGKISKETALSCQPEDPEATLENPVLKYADPGNVAVGLGRAQEASELPMSFYKDASEGIQGYVFTLPLSAVKSRAGEAEVTISSVIAAVFARSLEHVMGSPDGNIQIQVAINLRRLFPSITEQNFVGLAALNYPIAKCSKMPIEQVETIFRSQLDLVLDETNLIAGFNQTAMGEQALKQNPQIISMVAGKIQEIMNSPQAKCVYTHLTKLPFHPEVTKYLEDFEFLNSRGATQTGMVILARNYRDNVRLVLSQDSKDDCLVQSMENELKKEQIPYKIEKLEKSLPLYYDPYFYKGTPFYEEEQV
ncbi:MAG: hypothetical protein LKJ76_04970 [Lachnospiraceae bacterium]|jgi:hypothetical protein|nr:hypothetical protein [Lachnospiraceae bacterium]